MKYKWHFAKTIRDMPKKSGDYLMITDMGYPLTFYWDAHKRQAFYQSVRNRYDPKKQEYIDYGKVDFVRIDMRYLNFAWCAIKFPVWVPK